MTLKTILALSGLSVVSIVTIAYGVYNYAIKKYYPIMIVPSKIFNVTTDTEKYFITITNRRPDSLYGVGIRFDVDANSNQPIMIQKAGGLSMLDDSLSDTVGNLKINREVEVTLVTDTRNQKQFYMVRLLKLDSKKELEVYLPPKATIQSKVKEYTADSKMSTYSSLKNMPAMSTKFDLMPYLSDEEKVDLKNGLIKVRPSIIAKSNTAK